MNKPLQIPRSVFHFRAGVGWLPGVFLESFSYSPCKLGQDAPVWLQEAARVSRESKQPGSPVEGLRLRDWLAHLPPFSVGAGGFPSLIIEV
jgi:hypothetical protein